MLQGVLSFRILRKSEDVFLLSFPLLFLFSINISTYHVINLTHFHVLLNGLSANKHSAYSALHTPITDIARTN